MTIESPETINTTRVQTGQAAGSIDPPDMQTLVNSMAGLFTTTNSSTNPLTAALANRGTCVEMTFTATANTFRIPTNAAVPFDIGTVIKVRQMGTGATTIDGPGVTLRTASTFVIRAQYGSAFCHKRAADEWVIDGDLT